MQRIIRKFKSHEEAERTGREYYASLTPEQRLDIQLDLIAMQRGTDEAAQRLARVYRVIKLKEH